MPRVSIILPVRDAASTIGRALESCISQSWQDLEIIAVNDHSTDATQRILEEYSQRDQRLKVHSVPDPGGIVSALNLGVGKATGEILVRMDADDINDPQRVEAQLSLLDKSPELAAVGCQVRIVKPDGGDLGDGYYRYQRWLNSCVTPGQISRERFIESPLAHPSVMMRREALESVGGYIDTFWAEDYDLWLRMLGADMPIGKVPETLLTWTDGPKRLSRRDSRYSLDNFLRCKAHHISKMERVRDGGAVVWGAGPIGKRIARFLIAEGIELHSFVEVNPRQIGQKIMEAPVLSVEQIKAPGDAVHLAAVGQPGRRDEIRKCLRAIGAIEGEHFFCVA